jgi:hypothetical protein
VTIGTVDDRLRLRGLPQSCAPAHVRVNRAATLGGPRSRGRHVVPSCEASRVPSLEAKTRTHAYCRESPSMRLFEFVHAFVRSPASLIVLSHCPAAQLWCRTCDQREARG